MRLPIAARPSSQLCDAPRRQRQLVLAGFVTTIVLIARNVSRARAAGHDAFTLQTDLATRALDSELLAPARTTEARLAELEDLAARGVISAEERAAARAEILAGR